MGKRTHTNLLRCDGRELELWLCYAVINWINFELWAAPNELWRITLLAKVFLGLRWGFDTLMNLALFKVLVCFLIICMLSLVESQIYEPMDKKHKSDCVIISCWFRWKALQAMFCKDEKGFLFFCVLCSVFCVLRFVFLRFCDYFILFYFFGLKILQGTLVRGSTCQIGGSKWVSLIHISIDLLW